METLRKIHELLIHRQNVGFKRYLNGKVSWDQRLTGIKGFRGVGKTTLLLQYIKEKYGLSDVALYISLDHIYFTEHRFSDLVEMFVAHGGEHLFVDEIHKYPEWAVELKNVYDLYPGLRITFTGSSLLEILNSRADLSRRALMYHMHGLSFREYLNLSLGLSLKTYSLEEILEHHRDIVFTITEQVKPLKYFDKYLEEGYFPFFIDDREFYLQRLREIVNMIIDVEFPQLRGVDPLKSRKIKQLLYIIAQSVPFKPNISKLASRIGVSRNTLYEYLHILDESDLLHHLNRDTAGIALLQKPDKIYLGNPNLAFALSSGSSPDRGNMRETFFLTQLMEGHHLTYPDEGDFLVDGKYLFEIGGKNKTSVQIKGKNYAFLAVDDTEYGQKNRIPLWLFGFLY
jgi:predicted AAA+ superfamily ATPase